MVSSRVMSNSPARTCWFSRMCIVFTMPPSRCCTTFRPESTLITPGATTAPSMGARAAQENSMLRKPRITAYPATIRRRLNGSLWLPDKSNSPEYTELLMTFSIGMALRQPHHRRSPVLIRPGGVGTATHSGRLPPSSSTWSAIRARRGD